MILKVHFREKYMARGDDDLSSHAMLIEQELYMEEINYQSIQIKGDSQTV
jgi:hypothetical protein